MMCVNFEPVQGKAHYSPFIPSLTYPEGTGAIVAVQPQRLCTGSCLSSARSAPGGCLLQDAALLTGLWGALAPSTSGVNMGWQPLFVGLFPFLLQSLAAPPNPCPLPSLLPFFPALLYLCFSSKVSLTCCLSFPLLSLSDLKSINASIPIPAHLRAGDPRSDRSSLRKTRLLPSAPQRAADTGKCHSP